MTRDMIITRVSQVSTEAVEWLAPGRIAFGTLTLLDGDPGQGKSLITLDLAARLSTGKPFADCPTTCPPSSVLLLCAEDSIRHTIRPRLEAAGADVDRIHCLTVRRHGVEQLLTLPADADLLAQAVREQQARLVVIDPFLAFLSTSPWGNGQGIREALAPLTRLAEETRTAVVLVRHLIKGGRGQRAMYRGTGTMAIIGTARTAFLAGPHPDDPELGLFACTKSNLATPPETLAYRVIHNAAGMPSIEWTGPVSLTADAIVLPGRLHGDVSMPAVGFLQDVLGQGPVTRDSVVRQGHAEGYSLRTLERAKAELKAPSCVKREHGTNVWYWKLARDLDSERIMEELYLEEEEEAVEERSGSL